MLGYHLIVNGGSWAATDGVPPAHLDSGDVVMFPCGDAHVLSSAPGMRAPHDDGARVFATRNDPKPIPIAYRGSGVEPGATLPPGEASTIAICGFIGCDLRAFNPLIECLPRLLHLRAGGVGAWIAPVLHQAVSTSRQHRPGSAAALERVSEIVFVDAARPHLESLTADASGWLAALRDRHVGRAIGVLHERLAEPWTIDELGRQIGLSRSALHERFVRMVGLPPMQYLTNWWM